MDISVFFGDEIFWYVGDIKGLAPNSTPQDIVLAANKKSVDF
jgi:hypothetical protein